MAGIHWPRERMGGGTLPGPVLNVPPPPPTLSFLLARCMQIHAYNARITLHCAHAVRDELHSVHRFVHIMHEFADTAYPPRGEHWTPTPLPSTSSGRSSPVSS